MAHMRPTRKVEHRYVEEGITHEYKSDIDILVISHVELGPGRQGKWSRPEDNGAQAANRNAGEPRPPRHQVCEQGDTQAQHFFLPTFSKRG